MAKKETTTEPEIKICSICDNEILGSFEYIKTKRKTEIYICKNCTSKLMKQSK